MNFTAEEKFYRVGDIANGYILTGSNTWHLLPSAEPDREYWIPFLGVKAYWNGSGWVSVNDTAELEVNLERRVKNLRKMQKAATRNIWYLTVPLFTFVLYLVFGLRTGENLGGAAFGFYAWGMLAVFIGARIFLYQKAADIQQQNIAILLEYASENTELTSSPFVQTRDMKKTVTLTALVGTLSMVIAAVVASVYPLPPKPSPESNVKPFLAYVDALVEWEPKFCLNPEQVNNFRQSVVYYKTPTAGLKILVDEKLKEHGVPAGKRLPSLKDETLEQYRSMYVISLTNACREVPYEEYLS